MPNIHRNVNPGHRISLSFSCSAHSSNKQQETFARAPIGRKGRRNRSVFLLLTPQAHMLLTFFSSLRWGFFCLFSSSQPKDGAHARWRKVELFPRFLLAHRLDFRFSFQCSINIYTRMPHGIPRFPFAAEPNAGPADWQRQRRALSCNS